MYDVFSLLGSCEDVRLKCCFDNKLVFLCTSCFDSKIMKISQQYILVKYLFSNFLCLKLYYDVVVELFILFKIAKIIIILPKVKKTK